MLTTVLTISGIGLLCGVVLVIAAKFLAVPVDETAENIRNVLPGANCGACGYAGCDDYAGKLATDKTIKCTLCTPGGGEVAEKISGILGVACEAMVPQKAMVHCAGTFDVAQFQMEYVGPKTCKACHSFYKGRKSCTYGCIGYGDCVSVCNFNALMIVNGVAVIDRDLCTGCGACANICPTKIITIKPETSKVYVACSSHDKGGVTRKLCTAGCIGCMKCQKTCQFDAIHVVDGVASIQPDKCTSCGECIAVCPVHVIKKI